MESRDPTKSICLILKVKSLLLQKPVSDCFRATISFIFISTPENIVLTPLQYYLHVSLRHTPIFVNHQIAWQINHVFTTKLGKRIVLLSLFLDVTIHTFKFLLTGYVGLICDADIKRGDFPEATCHFITMIMVNVSYVLCSFIDCFLEQVFQKTWVLSIEGWHQRSST